MRKYLLSLAALLIVVNVWAERVSQEDAALVANHFINVESGTSGVRKAPAKRMVLKQAAPAAEENQFYIYENADGEGWVLVAADDVAHPILAYSETGRFRTDNMPANIKVWLNGYNRQIKRAAQDGLIAPESIQQEWNELRSKARQAASSVVVNPLIKSGWSQSSPYYNSCPTDSKGRCVTGCVATAMAQVMYYHKWPKQGTGSHSVKVNNQTYTANFGQTTYDWDNMLDNYTHLDANGYEVVNSGLTTAQKNAVATLMYHCGVAVDMDYSADVSGAYTIDFNGYFSRKGTMCAETALTQFFGYNTETVIGYYRNGDSSTGMKKWTKTQWTAMLKEELDAARPIMYAGTGCDDPNDDNTCYGHSFICDGYDSSDKFHFNFGWTNWCDGYYDIDALETNDPGTGGGNGNYSLDQDVIIGIQPEAGIEVAWEADGSLFTSNIAPAGKVVLPTTEPDACDGKVFVGWCAEADYENETAAPTFVKNGDEIATATTFYAVFATEETGGGATTWNLVTDASTLKAGDVLVMACQSENVTAGDISSQIMGSVSSSFEDNQISSLGSGTVELTLGGSAGAWTLKSSSGLLGATAVKKLAWDSGTTTWSISISSNNATITNGTSSYGSFLYNISNPRFTTYSSSPSSSMVLPQLYRKTGGGASYTEYTTSCGTAAEKYAIQINSTEHGSLSTSPSGEAAAGKTVTVTATPEAHYHLATLTVKDADNANVTVNGTGNTRTFIMPAKAVTVSGTFAQDDKYTINFYVGNSIQKTENLFAGETSTPPSSIEAPCEGYTFVGWWTTELAEDNTDEKTWVSNFTVNGAQDYYAVFSRTEDGGGGGSSIITFTPGTDTGETSVTKNGVTCTMTTMNNSSYYQIYADGSGTFTSTSGNITKIEFTCTASGTNKYGPGNASTNVGEYSYSGSNGTWTGESSSITLSASKQIRMSVLNITVGSGASSTTYYTTAQDCETPEPTYYSIRFFDNGTQVGETQVVLKGQEPEVPATPTAACDTYTFVGWWTSTLAADNTDAKSWVSNFTATKDQDYYAIYSKTEKGEISNDYAKISTLDELTTGKYVVAGNSAYAMKNEIYNQYYLSTYSVTPNNNKISSPAGNIIWTITRSGNNVSFFNESVNKYVYLYKAGSYYDLGLQNEADWFSASVSNGNWSFESKNNSGQYLVYFIYQSSTHEFAAKPSSSTPIHLYKQGQNSTTYYVSTVLCTPTEVEHVSSDEPVAVKAIRNGQIVIIRGEAVYSITGTRIQ